MLLAVTLNWSLNVEHNAAGLFLLHPSRVGLSASTFQTLCAPWPQSCPTLRDPTGCSPPGCAVHGIRQASILEWAAISFNRGSSWSRHWTRVSLTAGGFFTHWTNIACKYNLGFYYSTLPSYSIINHSALEVNTQCLWVSQTHNTCSVSAVCL